MWGTFSQRNAQHFLIVEFLPFTWTHYLSVLLHAFNKTALIWQEVPLKSASTHHYGDEAAQRSKNLSLAWLHRVLAAKIHIHDAKPSPLTAVHGFMKRLQGYVSVAGCFWRRRLFWGVSHSTGLEGEMQQESVTQCFLGLFFSPSPSVLSIFNVYGFYLSWHRQQPLWHCRYCRFSIRLRLDPDCDAVYKRKMLHVVQHSYRDSEWRWTRACFCLRRAALYSQIDTVKIAARCRKHCQKEKPRGQLQFL